MTEPPTAADTLAAVVDEMAGGEPRPGQRAMADAVTEAIRDKTHLLVQAGTGTGKSLAYLVPAICSRERVVVSTATKALQEQLVGKDLPDLAAILTKRFGTSFAYALLKGRSNYYCRVRGDTALDDPEMQMYDADAAGEVAALAQWSTDTDTGDRSDLETPVSDKAWRAVSMPPGECPGRSKCPRGQECFAEHARDRAGMADVVVVNHHLLALDLLTGGTVLPEHAVTVIDEAHQFADTVTDIVGAQCTPASLDRLLTRCSAHLAPEDAVKLEDAIEAFGDALRGAPAGRLRSLPSDMAGAAVTARAALARVLDSFKASNKIGSTEDDDAKVLALRAAVLSVVETLDRAQAGSSSDVVWVERGGVSTRDTRLRVAPLDVGQLLSMGLFSERTVIVTSATLAVAGGFGIPARRLGLPEPATVADADRPNPHAWTGIDVGSPFDFTRQGMLYVPRNFPAPQGSTALAHAQAVVDELLALMNAAGGRTLALFTTTRAVSDAVLAVRARTDHRILVQGDAPPSHLVRDFAADESSCLFATTSFWQGVDVPGAACSLVVIDKLPFPRPDDPLAVARREAADVSGGDGFTDVYVARAAVLLAQGVGRLIRSSADRGVVAVLDPRLATKSYGRLLLASLPPFRVWHDRAVVVGALQRLAAERDSVRLS